MLPFALPRITTDRGPETLDDVPDLPPPPAPDTTTTIRYRQTDVYVYAWLVGDGAERRGVIHLSHGVGEHALRYGALARALNEAGFDVWADDHLAHGQTGLHAKGLCKLPAEQNDAAIDAVRSVSEWLRETHDRTTPLIYLGHSWGSLIGQRLLRAHGSLYDAIVFSGSTRMVPGWVNMGDLDAPFKPDATGNRWLSRDPRVWKAFLEDPLCFDLRNQPVWYLRGALQLVGRVPSKLSGRLGDVPVLLMGGGHDSLSLFGRGLRALDKDFRRRAGLSDVTLKLYPGARHEIFNETNRDEVIDDLCGWLRERF